MRGFVDKVLARFTCASFNSHITWRKKLCYDCTTTSKAHVFLGNYNFALSSPLRVGSVEIIVYNVPHVFHAVESNFLGYIQTNAYPWE